MTTLHTHLNRESSQTFLTVKDRTCIKRGYKDGSREIIKTDERKNSKQIEV